MLSFKIRRGPYRYGHMVASVSLASSLCSYLNLGFKMEISSRAVKMQLNLFEVGNFDLTACHDLLDLVHSI